MHCFVYHDIVGIFQGPKKLFFFMAGKGAMKYLLMKVSITASFNILLA